jgi:hypothetical protein
VVSCLSVCLGVDRAVLGRRPSPSARILALLALSILLACCWKLSSEATVFNLLIDGEEVPFVQESSARRMFRLLFVASVFTVLASIVDALLSWSQSRRRAPADYSPISSAADDSGSEEDQ